tara:strand:+ start:451 stop:570 length:120 start_codon:yes stop_codon:yes gene_type:complete
MMVTSVPKVTVHMLKKIMTAQATVLLAKIVRACVVVIHM